MSTKPDNQAHPAPSQEKACCCSCAPTTPPEPVEGHSFIIGSVTTPAGEVPTLRRHLRFADRLGGWKVRWGFGRSSYRVEPGLYAIGTPDQDSPVLVTANYKLTFDVLRSSITGLDAWVLVLDTKGVNVWCAAGKGTFGTDELVTRVAASALSQIVVHRRLIAPQLGAPGVAAHAVKKATGFKVVWGPIRSNDISAFLAAGCSASPAMRRKTFTFAERAVLIPVELVAAVKALVIALPIVLLLGGLGWSSGGLKSNVATHGALGAGSLIGAVIAGAVLTPLLLPWLPGRAFSLKGVWPGLAIGVPTVLVFSHLTSSIGLLEATGWLLLTVSVSAYLAMNFTGASTYTSLSGVRKEMRVAVPLEISVAALAVGLLIAGRVV